MGAMSELLGKQLYLDTNVFIYALNAFAAFKPLLEELFAAADAGSLSVCTSELTVAEILVVPFRSGDQQAEQQCRLLLEAEKLELLGITRAILEQAARMRADNRALPLPDAIHLATARQSGCDLVLTNDQGFKVVSPVPVMLLAEAAAS